VSKPLPPLPAVLAEAPLPGPRPRKRERTRRNLITAAARVYTERGVRRATIREIAAAAEMTPVTIYNHFRSEAEIVQAVGIWIADTFCRRIIESYADVARGAERMAIGCRRFLWLAEQSPPWALLIADVAATTPALMEKIGHYVLADLRLGLRQKEFHAVGEAAALDLVSGTILQAMRRIASGRAPAGHARAVAATILRGLGLPPAKVRAILRRPLPAMSFARTARAAESSRDD
jgi:AcrR family transcriptional regulator